MPRLRLFDVRQSRLPRVVGLCADNMPAIAEYVNGAQRRLVMAKEAGDEGWWGSWAEIAFPGVSITNPFVTTPREVARVERFDVCQQPVPIRNQFYEYLDFGNGRLPKLRCGGDRWHCNMQAMTRNNVVTFVEQSVFPCILRAYATSANDIGAAKRVLLQGLDTTDEVIYSQDGPVEVQGEFVVLDTPFIQSTNQFNRITGFQKDVTYGPIQIMQVDPATNDETLLLTMQPTETVAGYRRYYLHNLPANCCSQSTPVQDVTVTAIVKLDLVPVAVDTDYLMLHNLEAIIEECIAIRMSEMDNERSQKLALIHHINAIRLLNSEITHYLGKQSPAVNFAPFGSARLERQNIGNQL